jgi:hypothetical protein
MHVFCDGRRRRDLFLLRRRASDLEGTRVREVEADWSGEVTHYTKNTLAVTAPCPQCKRDTLHRVDGGRRGPCIDPGHKVPELSQAQIRRREKKEDDRRNPTLFPL